MFNSSINLTLDRVNDGGLTLKTLWNSTNTCCITLSLNALLIGFRGKTCNINIDECASNPCNQRGQCIDGINSYTCNCTGSGYTGLSCSEDVDECQTTKPCHPDATCINHLGTYECNCQPGFTGKNCYENIDDCRSGPCQNGGTHLAFTRPYLCADWIYFMLEIV